MPKNKPHKGLLKRVKVTKTGKVKFKRAFSGHFRSGKSGKLLRSYRKSAYAAAPEQKKILGMILKKNPRAAKPAEAESSSDS